MNRLARLDGLAAKMHAEYMSGLTLEQVGKKNGRTGDTVWSLFNTRGLPRRAARLPGSYARAGATRRGPLDALVKQMHADYLLPMSMASVAKKYKRTRGAIRNLFMCRGLAVRPVEYEIIRLPNGCIAPAPKLTLAEIDALILQCTRIKVPAELKNEWRDWPIKKRGWFIARMRKLLQLPEGRPTGPFSANVEPFDYSSPRARAIAAKANAGLPSRYHACGIRITSQGVIYRDRLFFWSHENSGGAYYAGPWRAGTGRPSLHRTIWEEHNGRKMSTGEVLFHSDGNRNNLLPTNLAVKSKDDVCRENQAAALLKKSRAATQLILNRSQSQPHANTGQFILLLLRHAQRTPIKSTV